MLLKLIFFIVLTANAGPEFVNHSQYREMSERGCVEKEIEAQIYFSGPRRKLLRTAFADIEEIARNQRAAYIYVPERTFYRMPDFDESGMVYLKAKLLFN